MEERQKSQEESKYTWKRERKKNMNKVQADSIILILWMIQNVYTRTQHLRTVRPSSVIRWPIRGWKSKNKSSHSPSLVMLQWVCHGERTFFLLLELHERFLRRFYTKFTEFKRERERERVHRESKCVLEVSISSIVLGHWSKSLMLIHLSGQLTLVIDQSVHSLEAMGGRGKKWGRRGGLKYAFVALS